MSIPFAALFPGQGSQIVGMGRDAVIASPTAAGIFVEADQILGFALSELCFAGPSNLLNDTANAQPAILTASIAIWKAFQERHGGLLTPLAVAGHSLGEYSALVVSGALSFRAALRLVRARGIAMRSAGELMPGGMLAVFGMTPSVVEELCSEVMQLTGEIVAVANDNAPGQIVVAGHRRALETLSAKVRRRTHGLSPIPLNVSVAAHSPLMEHAMRDFLYVLAETPIEAPHIPIMGNSSAEWLTDADAIRSELHRQLVSRVRWNESMHRLIGYGATTFVEIGPGRVLTGLLRTIDRHVQRINIGNNAADLKYTI